MKITKELLEHQYIDLKKSSCLIAKEIGVKRHDISNGLFKFGITRKSHAKPGIKFCSDCKTEKPFNDFHKSKREVYGVCNFCKECVKIRAKKYYPNITKNRTTQKAQLVIEFGNKCAECGVENLPISCYVFHHVNEKMTDETYFTPNSILMSRNKDFVESQKVKLTLLCANCHNLLHSDCKLTAHEVLRE
jgi:hypothetical protein